MGGQPVLVDCYLSVSARPRRQLHGALPLRLGGMDRCPGGPKNGQRWVCTAERGFVSFGMETPRPLNAIIFVARCAIESFLMRCSGKWGPFLGIGGKKLCVRVSTVQ